MQQLPYLLFTLTKGTVISKFGQCCGAATSVFIPFEPNKWAFQWAPPLLQIPQESYFTAPLLILHYQQKGNRRNPHRQLKCVTVQKPLGFWGTGSSYWNKLHWWMVGFKILLKRRLELSFASL